MRRYTIVLLVAVAAAGLVTHGIAEARGGKSGGARSGRSGGWHSGSHYRGGHSSHYRGGYTGYRSHFGTTAFFVGAPIVGAGYGVYPHYGAAAASEPVYYIEKTDGYWYYCAEAARYYPDVEQCASPWIPVHGWTATPAP